MMSRVSSLERVCEGWDLEFLGLVREGLLEAGVVLGPGLLRALGVAMLDDDVDEFLVSIEMPGTEGVDGYSWGVVSVVPRGPWDVGRPLRRESTLDLMRKRLLGKNSRRGRGDARFRR